MSDWLKPTVLPIVEHLRYFKRGAPAEDLIGNFGNHIALGLGEHGWVKIHGIDEPQNGGRALVVELGPPNKNVILMPLRGEAPVRIVSQRFDLPSEECRAAWEQCVADYIQGLVTWAVLNHAHYDSR